MQRHFVSCRHKKWNAAARLSVCDHTRRCSSWAGLASSYLSDIIVFHPSCALSRPLFLSEHFSLDWPPGLTVISSLNPVPQASHLLPLLFQQICFSLNESLVHLCPAKLCLCLLDHQPSWGLFLSPVGVGDLDLLLRPPEDEAVALSASVCVSMLDRRSCVSGPTGHAEAA